jgi:hypothetical protein
MVSNVIDVAQMSASIERPLSGLNLKPSRMQYIMRGFLDGCLTVSTAGSEASKAAFSRALITWEISPLIRRDVDCVYNKLFLMLCWMCEFFQRDKAEAVDRVRLDEISSYHFRFTNLKKASR